ncbi:hypothetical protein DL765_007009 [Monosporascus sp. GIB2]|nr:hypothetical protein DL765_007009 [Monosporascus sp. GIB2]
MNAFVHSDLDETAYMTNPPGSHQPGKVCLLKKALDGLRRSPLLWQETLTAAFEELGFRKIPQELIRYGGDDSESTSFLCPTDASFDVNSVERKSSQGYEILLFGGAVTWIANKQDTVSTSSTNADALTISQATKAAIFLSRLFRAMGHELSDLLIIECGNKQTIRLTVEDAV